MQPALRPVVVSASSQVRKVAKDSSFDSSPTLSPTTPSAPPPALPVEEPDSFAALVTAATPLKEISNKMNAPLTPWGYPRSATKSDPKSAASSSAASWQTIRAGLLSPPPLSSALLLSPPPNERLDEVEDDAPPAEAPAGPGGWLVDLVEGMQGMELWSRPGPAIVSGAPAVPPTAS